MFNPTRRNRNIGTEDQGFGQDNRLNIPWSDDRIFFERLGPHQRIEREINGHAFLFLIEDTRATCSHACSVEDIARVLAAVPTADYGELRLIVLRQPTRKEAIVLPAWGRLVYSFDYAGKSFPAILLESTDHLKKLKWLKQMRVEDAAEFQRLIADGHMFTESGRYFTAPFEPANVRNTQLYRTLLHELGHYVHYLETTERPALEDEPFEAWEERNNAYHHIPSVEKEAFAHQYADRLRQRLLDNGIIPFDRL